MISLIVAKAKNNVIGNGQEIPWRLPSDFAYFRAKTVGHPIVMGRNTHESIGRALPGRSNVVVCDDANYTPKEGAILAPSLEAAISLAQGLEGGGEVFVIGGAIVYSQAIDKADRIYATEVDAMPVGDKLFPIIDSLTWEEKSRTQGVKTEKDDYDFSFVIYERI